MSCILKNNNYTEITNKYGVIQGEMLIREYAKSVKDDILDINPTTLEQIDIFYKNIQVKQLNTLKNALTINPNLSKKDIKLGLKGIKNSVVIQSLIDSFPNRFQLKNGKLFISETKDTGESLDYFRNLANQDNSIQPMIDFLNQENSQNISNDIIEIAYKLSEKFNIPFEIDNNLPSKGMIKDGVVYINLTNATLDTPFHEYLHPFLQAIKQQSPSIYKILSSKVKTLTDLNGNNIFDSLKEMYSNDEIVDEAIVQALGLQAAGQLLETSDQLSFMDMIKQAFIRLFQAFSKSGKNFDINLPFKSVVEMFLNDDVNITSYTSGTFYQKNSLTEVLTTLDTLNKTIQRVEKDSVEPDGDKVKVYENIQNPDLKYKSVHEEYIEPFYTSVYKRSNTMQPRDITAAEIGNYFHNAMEEVTALLIESDGTIRKNPLPLSSINVYPFSFRGSIAVTKDEGEYLYETAYKYMVGLIDKYQKEFGPDVRFLTEQRVIRNSNDLEIPSIVGTVDLLILGDGKFSVYDWKTMSTEWFDSVSKTLMPKPNIDETKEAAIKLQLGQYSQMFKLMTGWELHEAIAVPVEMNLKADAEQYNDQSLQGNFILKLDLKNNPSIISDPQTKKADKVILFPIIVSGVDLENRYLSDLINKLQLLIKKEKMNVSKGSTKIERQALNGVRINELRAMISWLSIQQTSEKLTQRIDYVAKEVQAELDELDLDKVNTEKLILLKEELSYYTDLSSIFKEEIESNINVAYTLSQYQWKVNQLMSAISEKNSKVIITLAANKFNVRNIDKLEREYSQFNRYLKDTSSISNIKTMAAMNAMKDLYNNKANKNSSKILKRLEEFMDLTQTDFDLFFDEVDTTKKGKLKLIEKYDLLKIQALYNTIPNSKDDNFLPAIKEHFDINFQLIAEVWTAKVKRAESNFINNITGFSDFIIDKVLKNDKTEEELGKIIDMFLQEHIKNNINTFYTAEELADENLQYSKYTRVLNTMLDFSDYWTENAFQMLDPFRKNKEGKITGIRTEYHTIKDATASQLYSDNFKYLISDEKRLGLYNLIMEINNTAAEYESIINTNPETFVPSMIRKIEKGISFKSILNNLSPDLEEDFDQASNFVIDPITGEKILSIPRLYNYSLAKETEPGVYDYDLFSRNLILMYGKLAVFSEYYNSRNELKNKSHLLLELEKSKKMLASDNKGIIKTTNAIGEEVPEILDAENKNYQFLKQMTDYYIYGKGAFESIKGKTFSFMGKKNISYEKSIRFLMTSRSVTTLSLNFKSALSTLMSGNLNAFFESNKNGIFTMKDFLAGNLKLASYISNKDDDYGILAKMHDIDPFIDDMSNERLNKLNKSKLGKIFTIENLMILMRSADRVTQFKVMYATLLNHIIINGELMLISDVVKKEMDYNNRFNDFILNKEFDKANDLKKERDTLIEEMKSKSLAYSKEDLTEEQMFYLRNITRTLSKQILGNVSKEDIYAGRLHLLGHIASQFRNWIPRLLNVRFGDPEINMISKRLEWGKFKTAWHALAQKDFLPMISSLITGLNDIASDRISIKYEEEKARFLDNGGDIEVFPDLSDFIDMYESNVRSTLKEVGVAIALAVLIYLIFSAGDDDDKPLPAYKKWLKSIALRTLDETIFFINPNAFVTIAGNVAPVLQTLVDFTSLLTHVGGEGINQMQDLFTNDEQKDLKLYKPTKYLFRLLPIFKESLSWMALFDDDFRKEWDIKL